MLSARGWQQRRRQGWKQPPPRFSLLNPSAVIFPPPSPCRQQPKPTRRQPGFEALTKKSTGYCVAVLVFLLEVPQLLGLLTHVDGQSGPHHPTGRAVSERHRICSRTPLVPDTLPALFPPQYPQKEKEEIDELVSKQNHRGRPHLADAAKVFARKGGSRHGDTAPAGYRAATSDGSLPRTEQPWFRPGSAGNAHAPSPSEPHFAAQKPAASPVLRALLPSAARPRFPAISRAVGGSTLNPRNASHPRSSCCRPVSETRANASPELPSRTQPTPRLSARLQRRLPKCSSSDRRSELNTSPRFFRERCKGIFPFWAGNSTERWFRGRRKQVLYRQDFLACGWIL